MSASLAHDYKFIKTHLLMFNNCQVVAETNKRIVIRFADDYEARGFALDMRREGFPASIRRGLKTDAFYAQVIL